MKPFVLKKLVVYLAEDGKSLDSRRLGVPPEGGESLEMVLPSPAVFLEEATGIVYLLDADKMNVRLGAVALPLKKENDVTIPAGTRIDLVLEGLEPSASSKSFHPVFNQHFNVNLIARGPSVLRGTWPPGDYAARLSNEFTYSSNKSSLQPKPWGPPRVRWYHIGFN